MVFYSVSSAALVLLNPYSNPYEDGLQCTFARFAWSSDKCDVIKEVIVQWFLN